MMAKVFPEDHRVGEAKAKDIVKIADLLRIEGLIKHRHEMVGPCPRCGGRDRFSINSAKQVFFCRHCQAKGGVIDLTMWLRDCSFPDALEWLCGPRQELSAEEIALREAQAEKNRQARQEQEDRERARAIQQGRRIWEQGLPAEGTPVRDYLARRGFLPDAWPVLPICLRFHPDLPFMVEDQVKLPDGRTERRFLQVHRGPAMLAAVQGPDSRFRAVHRTWIDLDQPKGKAVVVHPVTGEVLLSKKVQGSKKGGAIRLSGSQPADVMVMGEGIETTASAMVSGVYPGAAFWAGVDLGNMSGQRQMGKGLMYAGIPDLDDAEAFVPPPWVKRLIYVQDGDSEPKSTRAKLLAGLRRAMVLQPGLKAQIVHAGEGLDLNDVLMGQDDG